MGQASKITNIMTTLIIATVVAYVGVNVMNETVQQASSSGAEPSPELPPVWVDAMTQLLQAVASLTTVAVVGSLIIAVGFPIARSVVDAVRERRRYPRSIFGTRRRVEVEPWDVDYCVSCGSMFVDELDNVAQAERASEFRAGERRRSYEDRVAFGVAFRERLVVENTYCEPCAEDPITAELRAERFDDLPEPSVTVDDLEEATEAEA